METPASGTSKRSTWRTRVSKTRRNQIFTRDNWSCYWCEEPVSELVEDNAHNRATIDHIAEDLTPAKRYNSMDNIVTACWNCNNLRAQIKNREHQDKINRQKEGDIELDLG